ncbi:MAG: PQQ-dependent sugar dehydrogenase [Chloroflexi bacterium]|nr:PQQ-dependent sugar dehydrogenase [Chloroflexota bacterium]
MAVRRIRVATFGAVLVAAAVLAAACPRANGYRGLRIFPDIALNQTTGMYVLPDDPGTALLLTKGGVVYRASLAGGAPTPFLDIRSRLIPNPDQEEGLLGLAFAPDFASSRRFYVYYTAGSPRHNRISRFIAGGATADAGSEQVVLDLPEKRFPNHNGGALAFGPDGMLYVGVGDGGGSGDPDRNGQNLNSLFGKILRIDVRGDGYAVPADNPFARGGGLGEIFAYGLRNPWRLTFDTVTGQLWTGDVGENAWEEVDRVVSGGNYGWSAMEGAHCFDRVACERTGGGKLLPRAEYSHDFGCSVTGGYVYRGATMPELDGWYIYGDFCSGRVWAVDIATDASAAIPLADTGASISAFAQDAAGEVYVVDFGGAILKLVRK